MKLSVREIKRKAPIVVKTVNYISKSFKLKRFQPIQPIHSSHSLESFTSQPADGSTSARTILLLTSIIYAIPAIYDRSSSRL